jgi:hypothetical protein
MENGMITATIQIRYSGPTNDVSGRQQMLQPALSNFESELVFVGIAVTNGSDEIRSRIGSIVSRTSSANRSYILVHRSKGLT